MFQPLHPAHLPPPSPPWSPSTSAVAKAAFLLFPGSSFRALFTESGCCHCSAPLQCWEDAEPSYSPGPFPRASDTSLSLSWHLFLPHPDGDLLSLHFALSCLRPSGTIRHINSLHLDLKPQLHTYRYQHKVPASSGVPTSHLCLLHLGI